jgi:transposase
VRIIKMSERELTRGEWIARVVAGACPQKRAAKTLRLSVRQIKRLCRNYRKEGIAGIVHKSRGRTSNRKISTDRRKQACAIITEKYPDFGPQLAKEVLEKRHGLKFSREWLRQLRIEAGLWEAKQRKSLCVHQRRERRSREGELVQIDGSYHKWFEDRGPACCLINMIDDATGKLKELKFVEHESTQRYMEEHNSRFSRLPKNAENANIPLSQELDLDRVLCVKEKRKVSKQLTVQYGNKTYQLNPQKNCRRMIGRSVNIYEMGDKIVIDYEGKKIDYRVYEEQPYVTVMDRKRLDSFLDRKLPMSIIQRRRKGILVNF